MQVLAIVPMKHMDRDIENSMFAGLDVGSRTSKAVLLDTHGIVGSAVIPTGANPRQTGEAVLTQALEACGGKSEQVKYVVGTGYGRVNLPFADRTVTELTCHAKGAYFHDPRIRTVIDIGGQDSKVIRIDENGNMLDFSLNDKCAAGTGRFLEVMARAMELDVAELGHCALSSHNHCPITSICAVFAESEVISLLASGQEKNDVAAGLHRAIAQRVGNMALRVGIEAETAFVGGVARNPGVAAMLEDFLGIRFIPDFADPQLNGAVGAAVLARETFYGK